MKKLHLFLVCSLFALSNSFAQNYFNLILFSEEGERFDAYVNGIKQNVNPESNIKITELISTAINVRIIFENKAYPQLKQSFMLENGFEHTLTIKRNMKKVWKIRYFAKTPLASTDQNTGTVVVPYHTTDAPTQTGSNTNNSQTDSNPTSTTNTNSTSVTINTGGVNINVMVNETQTGTSQTGVNTTTTSNATPPKHVGTFTNLPVDANPSTNTGCSGAMNAATYEKMKKTIDEKPFSDTKMSTAKVATKNACLSSDQIIGICKLFSMDDDKLEYAKYAYDACVDKANYFHVSSVFTFSGTTDDFNQFLQTK
jgi:hypothetical protein